MILVTPDEKPKARPLFLIEENGSWGVDLIETYAQWNELQSSDKQSVITKLTAQLSEARENMRRSSCQSNLKQIALGIKQYEQDYDEKFPLAKPWIDVLQPYLKSEEVFNCPSLPNSQRYGYAYNSKLSHKPEQVLTSISETVAVYETNVLKRNAYGMGENIAYRHLDGANFAFADGHVKWFAKAGKQPSFFLNPR